MKTEEIVRLLVKKKQRLTGRRGLFHAVSSETPAGSCVETSRSADMDA